MYRISTLYGEYETTDWNRVFCPSYDPKTPDQIFIIFQTKNLEFHFIEDEAINVIEEIKEGEEQ